MPVYNEEKTIHLIVERVLARPEVGELVMVNDCSKDGTWPWMQEIAKTDPAAFVRKAAIRKLTDPSIGS